MATLDLGTLKLLMVYKLQLVPMSYDGEPMELGTVSFSGTPGEIADRADLLVDRMKMWFDALGDLADSVAVPAVDDAAGAEPSA